MTEEPIRRPISRNEWLMVVASTVAASALASLWSWRHGAMLNYGDAVAHLHIARRVIDSHRPGLSQLGSVWLPLPHLLLIPFVAVYAWWADGIAGMIPSALAYIAGCAGVYRLARHWLRPSAAVVALAFFALNPEPALPADHGDDGAVVSLRNDLARRVACGVAGRCQQRSASSSAAVMRHRAHSRGGSFYAV